TVFAANTTYAASSDPKRTELSIRRQTDPAGNVKSPSSVNQAQLSPSGHARKKASTARSSTGWNRSPTSNTDSEPRAMVDEDGTEVVDAGERRPSHEGIADRLEEPVPVVLVEPLPRIDAARACAS